MEAKFIGRGVAAAELQQTVSFFQQTEAYESCSRDVMSVASVPAGDAIDIVVKNKQSAEITVTLEAHLKNMVADVPLPHTATFPGNMNSRAFRIRVADPMRAWDYRWGYHWTWGPLDAKHDDAYVYSLPYAPGEAYRIDQGFNGKFSHFGDFEYSIDWNMPVGTKILAARGGVVVGVRDDFRVGGPTKEYENGANYVMIKHPDGTIGEYAHITFGGAVVSPGERVRAGQLIAYSGNTGLTTGPHLHFFVYKAVDGTRRESFPVRFRVHGDKPVMLIEGQTYAALGSA